MDWEYTEIQKLNFYSVLIFIQYLNLLFIYWSHFYRETPSLETSFLVVMDRKVFAGKNQTRLIGHISIVNLLCSLSNNTEMQK